MANTLRFLIIGDLIGSPGLRLFEKWIPQLKKKHNIDAVFVNGENAAKNGNGLTQNILDFLCRNGATIVTTGNHAWDQKNIYNALEQRKDIIRPANYPTQCPGKGYSFVDVKGYTVGVINIHGRVFVKDALDCPFKTADSLLALVRNKTNIIFLDFHAEATSEKRAMGMYLDGKVSAVYGTHTHVQTADEMIMPGGTGYLTDLGCCGAVNSVIGMEYEGALRRLMIHHKFGRFVVEERGSMMFCGMWVEVDASTGFTTKIERVRVIDDEIAAHEEEEKKL